MRSEPVGSVSPWPLHRILLLGSCSVCCLDFLDDGQELSPLLPKLLLLTMFTTATESLGQQSKQGCSKQKSICLWFYLKQRLGSNYSLSSYSCPNLAVSRDGQP